MTGSELYTYNINQNIKKFLDKNPDNKKILSLYLNYMGTDKSANTKLQYLRVCNKFLNETFTAIENLGIDDYMEFFGQYNEKTPSYRMMVYAALSSFSDYLFQTDKCQADYMRKIKAPKQIESQETVEKREQGVLDDEQVKQLLYNVKHGVGSKNARAKQATFRPRDEFLITLMLVTGARVAAIDKMDVDDIKYEEDAVYITTTEKRGKVRKYYLSPEVRILMEEYLEFRKECLGDNSQERALFISKSKKRMTTVAIRNLVQKFTKDFHEITPHKLRATFATKLYEARGDVYSVQIAMGHSTPATTEKYIRGKDEEIRREVGELMSNAFSIGKITGGQG